MMKADLEARSNPDAFWVQVYGSTTTLENSSALPSQAHALS